LEIVDRKITVEEKRKASLDILFKSLLHNVLTGKVRVNDLAISEVEGVV
jgi:type I restriction enzyme S subunit